MSKLKNYLYEAKENDAEDEIMSFLFKNPSPKDKAIHDLAEKMGIDPDEFEAKVYGILGSILGAGKAKETGFTEEDADSKELAMGIKVEMEHTTNKKISKRIALDHLAEIPDYYTRLKKMESDAGIED